MFKVCKFLIFDPRSQILSPEAPTPDTAAPAHDTAALVVQATADGAASMHALRSAVLSGEFGLALGRALNAEPRLDEPRLAPGAPVRLGSLTSRPALNGTQAVLVARVPSAQQHWAAGLQCGP